MFVIGIVFAFIIFPNIVVLEEKKDKTIMDEEGFYFSSNQWTSDEIMLDGILYRLNADFLNFSNHGWSFDMSRYGFREGYRLNRGEKVTTNIDLISTKYPEANVQVGFVNLGKEARDIEECQVWSIMINNHNVATPVDFTLPGGIHNGSTEEEIFAAYGALETVQVYRSITNGYTTYHYKKDYTQYLDLTVYDDGGLQNISFRHY